MNIELCVGEYRTMHRQKLDTRHPVLQFSLLVEEEAPGKAPQSVFEIPLSSTRSCYRRLLGECQIFSHASWPWFATTKKFLLKVQALPYSC